MFSSFSCIIRCLPEYILQDTLKNCNFRRVGKTALINEFYKDKPTIFFSAMLQHIIDHKWTESKMYLILCGSSMSFMENQVLGKESPLYGRRTGQFKIEPLDYKETAVFHPNLSVENNLSVGR